jgi:hypothetical protein
LSKKTIEQPGPAGIAAGLRWHAVASPHGPLIFLTKG